MKRSTVHEMIRIPAWLILLPLLSCQPVFGQDDQSHGTIRKAARDYLMQQIEKFSGKPHVTIGNLDPRLRLARCGRKLTAFLPPGGHVLGKTSIGIRCQGEKPWTLYVPARVEVLSNVLVAKRYLPRGTRLKDDDYQFSERDLSTLSRGYFTEPGRIKGRVVKQPLHPNTVFVPTMLNKAVLVHRGEQVIILAKARGLEVRMKGKALMDGGEGDLVQVRALVSRRIIEGHVLANGVIYIPI